MGGVRIITAHATIMARITTMAIAHALMVRVILIITTTTTDNAIIIVRIGKMLRLIGIPITDKMITNKMIIDKEISNKAVIVKMDIAHVLTMAIANKATFKSVHSNVGPTTQMQNIA